jgi:hypothetical protein
MPERWEMLTKDPTPYISVASATKRESGKTPLPRSIRYPRVLLFNPTVLRSCIVKSTLLSDSRQIDPD